MVVYSGNFCIGLIHGHQVEPWLDLEALPAVQRKLFVDILVSGNTHLNQILQYEGKYFINPGSATRDNSS